MKSFMPNLSGQRVIWLLLRKPSQMGKGCWRRQMGKVRWQRPRLVECERKKRSPKLSAKMWSGKNINWGKSWRSSRWLLIFRRSLRSSGQGLLPRRRSWKWIIRSKQMRCSSLVTSVVWGRSTLLMISPTTLLMRKTQLSTAPPRKIRIRMLLGPPTSSDYVFMFFPTFHSFIWIWLYNEHYIPINAYLFPFTCVFLINLLQVQFTGSIADGKPLSLQP